jgi:enoyl-CoA hydratase/carnithine racemase
VALTKRLAYELLGETDREVALHREWELFRWMGRQPDSAEGVASFVDKRPPAFSDPKNAAAPSTGNLWEAVDD